MQEINCVYIKGNAMRVEKDDPGQKYSDFWDWLNRHPVWFLGLFIGYIIYLQTTIEV